jgi:hypothetical protein
MKMETNDKITRLLDMTEHPERYSEEEINEMLEDEECRAYYELMVKTDNAYTKHDEADAEEALHDFRRKHERRSSWRYIAAIFIGIIVVSCLTFAAIAVHRHDSKPQSATKQHTENVLSKPTSDDARTAMTDSVGEKEKVFDNVELQNVLKDISAYYHLQLEYHSDASKHLRLHLRWDKTQGAAQMVEALNHFDHVNITLTGDKITVE